MFGRVMPPPIYTVLVPSETVSPPMAEGDEIKDATWATAWIIWGGQHRPRVEGGLSEKQVCRGQRLGCCGASADAGVSQAQTPPPHAEASGGASPAHTTGSTRPRAPTAEGDISGSEATGFVIMWYSVPVHCLCEIYSFIFIILGILWYL